MAIINPFKKDRSDGPILVDLKSSLKFISAYKSIQGLLATRMPDDIWRKEIETILNEGGISEEISSEVANSIWRAAFMEFLKDDEISRDEKMFLLALRRLLDICEDDVLQAEEEILYPKYKKYLATARNNSAISEKDRSNLLTIAGHLGISIAIANHIIDHAITGTIPENMYVRNSNSLRKPRTELPKLITEPLFEKTDDELAGLMNQLSNLIGLDSVKKEVDNLSNQLKVQRLRKSKGLATSPIPFHLVFTGNPGTGKTTIARLLSKILACYGLLSKGHFVETDRAGLVGGYLGQTALKTEKVVKDSIGGVLFIDEAYSLAPRRADEDMFGLEAIETLLKLMEDNRDDLVVIVAGYKEPMSHFLEVNPGLKSRFTRFIDFPDYTAEELYQIYSYFLKNSDYYLTDSADSKIIELFHSICAKKGNNFANGRLARTVFERTLALQADRLAQMHNPNRTALRRIDQADIPFNEQFQ